MSRLNHCCFLHAVEVVFDAVVDVVVDVNVVIAINDQ